MRMYTLITAAAVLAHSVDGAAEEAAEASPAREDTGNTADEQDFDAEQPIGHLQDGQVIVVAGESQIVVELPGPAVAIFQHGEELFVALGPLGAVMLDISDPEDIRLLKTVSSTGEEITGFMLIDGEVWMRSVATKIVPVGGGDIGATLATPAAAGAEPTGEPGAEPSRIPLGREIRILEIAPGKVTLDAGANEGIEVGDRFSVFKAVSVEGAGDERFEGAELAAVIQVEAVSADRCLATIWRGDRVTANDTVRPHLPDHRISRVYPRHLTHLAEISVTFRPILNVVGPIGFGALNDLSFRYWGKWWYAGAFLSPLGFAFTDSDNILVMTAVAEAGYDARAFAIGIGAGVNKITFLNNAFTISQYVRLGARDGLNVVARNAFHLRRQDDYDWDGNLREDVLQFEWGGMSGRINIPLTARTTMFFGGGGSDNYAFGEGGVHAWLIGNGDAGSLGLSVAAGGAGLMADNEGGEWDPSVDYVYLETIGPMMSLGLNYRLGFNRR